MNSGLSKRKVAWNVLAGALGFVVGMGLARVTKAEDADLPSAEAVIERHIEATGGAEAHASIDTRHAVGTFAIEAMGITAKVETWNRAPHDERFTIDVPNMGVDMRGVSGGVAWEDPLQGGPRILEGDEALGAIRRARLRSWLTMADYFESMECVGVEDVEGEECYRIDVVATNGDEESLWFSVDSGLETKSLMTIESQMGPVEVELLVSDYRDVGGVKVNFHIVQRVMGAEQTLVFETVEHNVEIPEGTFDLPESVAALADG